MPETNSLNMDVPTCPCVEASRERCGEPLIAQAKVNVTARGVSNGTGQRIEYVEFHCHWCGKLLASKHYYS